MLVYFSKLGTKVMCREGGCGCCVVSVTRRDMSSSKDETKAVNSVRSLQLFLFEHG